MAGLIQTVEGREKNRESSQYSTTASKQGFIAHIGATAPYVCVVEVRLETTCRAEICVSFSGKSTSRVDTIFNYASSQIYV